MNGPEKNEREQQMEFEVEDPRMKEFEQALSRAMQRVEVRAETSAKFLALAEEAERKRAHTGDGFRLIKLSNGGRVFAMPRFPQARAWMGGAIAAVLAMGIFAGTHIHEQHERRAVAQEQFETAERITDQTLARTRAELEQRGINLEQ
ncbi:MAG TPA: hypothetical protein VN734_08805 [Acidobacteriaceae bacterium]|nr:hypothetical protein [Acidobacteriaceae bacterium]